MVNGTLARATLIAWGCSLGNTRRFPIVVLLALKIRKNQRAKSTLWGATTNPELLELARGATPR